MTGPIVETPQGRVQGASEQGVLVFRNLPYAQAGRFEPPRPPTPWSGVRDGLARGPISPQAPSRMEIVTGPAPGDPRQSEACQVLTVTTPGLQGRRPVIVWLHGGAYVSGGGELAWYDAHRLAAQGEVVVVTVTYRLGVFGYLWREAPEARNLGLADQAAALAWVASAIDRFGGDPHNLTLAGQSAGGHAVAALLAAPGPPPFRRAVLQSAPVAVWPSAKIAQAFAADLERALGRDPAEVDTRTLLAAQGAVIAARREGLPVGPVVDPAPISRQGVDLLAGFTRDDGSPFVALGVPLDSPAGARAPEEAVQALTRSVFADPTLAFAARPAGGARTFVYRLDWRPRGSAFGACHALDAALLFGDQEAWRAAPMLGEAPWPQVEGLGRRVRAAWAAFARTGDPSSEAGGDWKPYRSGDAGTINALDV
jgi:para-nitrobenzyl esterase